MASENFCECNRRGVLQILDAGSLLLVLVLQGSILNFYIISHYKSSVNPYFWFIADFVCLFIFAGTFSKSYRYFKQLKENRSLKIRKTKSGNNSSELDGYESGSVNGGQISQSSRHTILGLPVDLVGSLPLSYTSWLFYAIVLTGKVGTILKSEIPDKLSESDTFGPQMLKLTIGLSAIIYLLLVEGHTEFSPGSEQSRSSCSRSALEILDTISFLSLLLVKETNILEDVVVTLAAINFLLPTLPLYSLAVSGFGAKPIPLVLLIARDLLRMCLLDIPYLVVRVYFWAAYHQDISLFLMKNLLSIILVIRGLYPDIVKLLKKWKRGRVVRGSSKVERHEFQLKVRHNQNAALENVEEENAISGGMQNSYKR